VTRRARIMSLVGTGLLASLALGCSPSPDVEDQAGAPPSVPLVDQGRLSGYLPAPADWQRGDTTTAQVELPAPASHAATSYSREAARIDLEIIDTAGQAEYLEATIKIAGTDFDRTSDNGYVRGTTVGGFPAVESWNHIDRLAELTVLVADRFVVHASASGLEGIATLLDFIGQIDLEGLAALRPQ